MNRTPVPATVPSQARVVVIGGGIAGCSTLYHLTRLGWQDVVLIERDELTSGSTWHAAAQVTQFGGNQTMLALKHHSIRLYQQLAEDADHPFDYFITGGMRTAYTRDQIDIYRHHISLARGMGINMEFIDAAEAGRRHPLLNTDGLLGAWWDPLDGYIDPAGITHALARQARRTGALVSRFNPVKAISRKNGPEFVVHTAAGDIQCEHIVNAGGYRANEICAMLGTSLPVTSMEHMYFLTETIDEIGTLDFRVPIIRDPGADFYSRQEKHGLLVGIYEQGCKTFGMDGIDPDFSRALCPSDLDRCLDNMESVFHRLPCLANTGITSVINGPITYTIDGLPLVGPIPGIQNAWCCTGLRAGIGEGGGHGKILADLIVHGECEWDAWCLDPRRFTGYANTELTCLKAIEDYRNEFHYHLPHEHRPAARLARTSPLYPVLASTDAAFGVVNGWERVLFYKPEPAFEDTPGFRFSETDNIVAQEIETLRRGVSLMEVSGFNSYLIEGAQAGDFLDTLSCSRLPTQDGKIRLCYLLNDNGHILSEATITRLADNRYLYASAAASEWHDRDWLRRHRPHGVHITEQAGTHTLLVVAGPQARTLLQSLSPRTDFSNEAFPWMSAAQVMLGHAQMLVLRVSYSGETAYELLVANEQLYLVHQLLTQAGRQLGMGRFGLYATESMRLEKGYRHWKADLTYEFNPIEAALGRFVQTDKNAFIGKQALLQQIARGDRKKFVSLVIDGDKQQVMGPAHSGASICHNGILSGSVTSGGWGHRTGCNIAMGWVDPDHAAIGTRLTIDILGRAQPATIVEPSLYDPDNSRVRA